MAADLDFYFDFSSPYGYFASMKIDALAAEFGRKVKWQPVLLGAIFKTTGGKPLPEIPVKGQYALRDIERTARFHGIEYRRPPAFPIGTVTAARATVWIRDTLGHEKAVAFAKIVYRNYFVDGIDMGQVENVLLAASLFGLDPRAVSEAVASAAVKEKLRTEVDQALQLGVFGSPYVVADGEPFWGFDRFDQLRTFLQDGKI
jgi:2-hydroxychromene-2-carboxylate isomerase